MEAPQRYDETQTTLLRLVEQRRSLAAEHNKTEALIAKVEKRAADVQNKELPAQIKDAERLMDEGASGGQSWHIRRPPGRGLGPFDTPTLLMPRNARRR